MVSPTWLRLLADLAAEEHERDDGDDGDEREDECVFGETLTLLVTTTTDAVSAEMR